MKRRRDLRVDQLGAAGEVAAQAEKLKELVKGEASAGVVLEGDFFEAMLVEGEACEVSVSALLKLKEAGRLTRDEFCGLVTAKVAPTRELLDKATFLRISRRFDATPRFNVKRKTGAPAEDLAAALATLSKTIGPKGTPAKGKAAKVA